MNEYDNGLVVRKENAAKGQLTKYNARTEISITYDMKDVHLQLLRHVMHVLNKH